MYIRMYICMHLSIYHSINVVKDSLYLSFSFRETRIHTHTLRAFTSTSWGNDMYKTTWQSYYTWQCILARRNFKQGGGLKHSCGFIEFLWPHQIEIAPRSRVVHPSLMLWLDPWPGVHCVLSTTVLSCAKVENFVHLSLLWTPTVYSWLWQPLPCTEILNSK